MAAASQEDSGVSTQASSELQQITLHPDVLSELIVSISTAIINGLKAGTSGVQNAQFAPVVTPQSVNE